MVDLKSIGQNAILYGIGNACLRLAAFLLTPLYTYSLSLGEYGLLMTVLVTVQVLVIVTGLGTPTGFMRLAGDCERRNELGHLVVSTTLLQALSSATVTGLILLLLQPMFRTLFHTESVTGLVILAGAMALAQSLLENALAMYRLHGEGRRFIIACAAVFAGLIGLNIVFLRVFHLGIPGALAAQIGAYGGVWLSLTVDRARRLSMGFSTALTKELFRFSCPLVFSSASSVLGDVSAIYFLSYFVSLEQVSIYSLALKITGTIGILLILPFQMAYEPLVYRNIQTRGIERTIAGIFSWLMVAFAFAALMIAFAFRDLLRVIAPPEYHEAYALVFVLLPAFVFRCMYYIGESLANVEKKTRAVAVLATAINLTSIATNYIMVKTWGLWGAVLMFDLSMAAAGAGLLALGYRYHPIPIEWARVGSGTAMLALFLATAYGLHGQSSWVFYILTPVLTVGLGGLYVLRGFCTPTEKRAVAELYRRWRYRQPDGLSPDRPSV